MLRDLDRRQAMGAADAAVPLAQVMAVGTRRKEREWFWRVVAALMLVALGWVAWVAYQIQPRLLATDLAMSVAEQARRQPAAAVSALPQGEAGTADATAAKDDADAPAPPREPMETFRLALSIETPIGEAARPAPRAAQARPARALKPKPEPETKAATAQAAPLTPAGPRLERREPVRTPAQRAETEFRRAVALLNQARVSEAEEAFAAALASEPRHEAARQAMVAIQIEQNRLDDARRLLQEGLALNPARVQFAVVLARIFVERGEHAAALDVLRAAKGPENDPGYYALLGTVLQRLGRHADAAEAYQQALRLGPQAGATWVGFGISLEALGRRPDAAQAYRQALATGALAGAVREYAETRARALR